MAGHPAEPFGRVRGLRTIAPRRARLTCRPAQGVHATAVPAPGQGGESGANIAAMLRSFRKPIALAAAYLIALHILVSGFAIGLHAVSVPRGVFGSLAVFCGGKNSTGDAPPHQHDNGCGACPFACGGHSVAAVMPGGRPAPAPFADQTVAPAFPTVVPPIPAKHRPQTSRAPPVDA